VRRAASAGESPAGSIEDGSRFRSVRDPQSASASAFGEHDTTASCSPPSTRLERRPRLPGSATLPDFGRPTG